MIFTPNYDFYCEETGSQYCKGLTYTVKKGNKVLNRLVGVWLAKKVVSEVAPASRASLTGTGETGEITSFWKRWLSWQ